ncbi:MAG: 3-oxoacyl-ACP reductase FabG [Oscillospiraceae bacterium]
MKTAIITGASKGIGAKTAICLAMQGYNIAVNYLNSKKAAYDIVEKITSLGAKALAFKADVSQRSQVDEMVLSVKKEFGKIDLLVNNAGIAQQKLFTDITSEDWDKMVGTNLTGVFNCTQAVLKDMIRQKSGNIINVSSIWGITGGSCEVHYSAVKAGIIGLTKALAKEVGPCGINVNCVAPGVILTDMNANLDEQTLLSLKEETPLNRIGTTDDIANAICFLASDNAKFITGQVLSPNGGIIT